MKNKKIVIVTLLAVLVICIAAYILWPQPAAQPDYTQCSQEAKLCPDGSYVGRTGLDCAFAACPETSPPTVNSTWETYTDPDEGISFQYPEVLSATYITAAEWPPVVNTFDGPLGCVSGGNEITPVGSVEKRTVDNRTYCVTQKSGAAAGSVYTTYTYATQINSSVTTFTFTLRFVQCMNYDDPKSAECLAERESFDIDGLVDRIVQTVQVH